MNPRGEQGEALAAAFLQKQGLAVTARNYRCRFGEIDLIARDGETVVFVEVRSRAGSALRPHTPSRGMPSSVCPTRPIQPLACSAWA